MAAGDRCDLCGKRRRAEQEEAGAGGDTTKKPSPLPEPEPNTCGTPEDIQPWQHKVERYNNDICALSKVRDELQKRVRKPAPTLPIELHQKISDRVARAIGIRPRNSTTKARLTTAAQTEARRQVLGDVLQTLQNEWKLWWDQVESDWPECKDQRDLWGKKLVQVGKLARANAEKPSGRTQVKTFCQEWLQAWLEWWLTSEEARQWLPGQTLSVVQGEIDRLQQELKQAQKSLEYYQQPAEMPPQQQQRQPLQQRQQQQQQQRQLLQQQQQRQQQQEQLRQEWLLQRQQEFLRQQQWQLSQQQQRLSQQQQRLLQQQKLLQQQRLSQQQQQQQESPAPKTNGNSGTGSL